MSKQAPTDPLPHIKKLAAAVRLPDQPIATFRALDAAMDAVIGHTYITVLLYHVDLQEIERFYSSKLDAYPCLLYTSPSPRDLSTSRMPSSA